MAIQEFFAMIKMSFLKKHTFRNIAAMGMIIAILPGTFGMS